MSQPSTYDGYSLIPVGFFQAKDLKRYGEDYAFGGPLDIVYGNDKENKFFGGSASRQPIAFVGGEESDSYRFTAGQLGIVADSLGGSKDTLDFTKIDRAAALWGTVRIGNDIILSDVISGMTVLIHDWNGVENPNNKIEYVKAQYRDPVTNLVNPGRSQRVALADWISNALPLPGADFANYGEYNAALGVYRQADSFGQLEGALGQALSALGPDYVPLAPAVANVIRSLPTTDELGIAASAVNQTWADVATNALYFG